MTGVAFVLATRGAAEGTVALYATDTETQALYTLNLVDASATLVGPLGVDATITGLAYDSTRNVLYGVGTTETLYTIDMATGAATAVGSLGGPRLHSLAYDEVSSKFYGAGNETNDTLYEVDPATGHATAIGSIGTTFISALAFHPETHVLYAATIGVVGFPPGKLLTIDTSTGAGTLVAQTQRLSDMAFHPETGVLYGAYNGVFKSGGEEGSLWTVNVSTGDAVLIDSLTLYNCLGIAFAPEAATLALLALGGTVGLLRRCNAPAPASRA